MANGAIAQTLVRHSIHMKSDQRFKSLIETWRLTPDGDPILTHSSALHPVLYENKKAILKIATSDEEKRGNALMAWWSDRHAPVAPVLAYEKDALLMLRARGQNSLIQIARNQDTQATQIMGSIVQKLHAIQCNQTTLDLMPLSQHFRALSAASKKHGGIFQKAHQIAQDLLSNPVNQTLLHGDIHHGNILDFENLGYLAIDPKGLIGESYFDFANLFLNPDMETATRDGRLEAQLDTICKMAELDRRRLLSWVLAYAGLSAAWHLEDGTDPTLSLTIAEMALTGATS